ncbi:hypothetical protein ACFFQF_29915 [Haladaptatus pallidirubidus]|uniref:IclR-ED domain-containing protein n=1 Tax=Haladaptatus pallidirubidus TaxID=1008152 RepID=A0AAV3UHA0_9EURY|nr:hypothetical protein [Haladaptatus pallidirubidus]
MTDPIGSVRGAIGIGGPTYRMKGNVFREDLPSQLLRTVSEVEERLATVYDTS